MRPMNGVWTWPTRVIAIGALGVVMALTFGCRKSSSQQKEEKREELNVLEESELKRQEAVASNRRRYEEAKQLIAQRKYDEAWAEFEAVAKADPEIAFEFEMYKSENLPESLFRVADDLSSLKKRQFQEAYRTLAFVRDHIEKKRATAEKKIVYLKRLKAADDRYVTALRLIEAYERVKGMKYLDEVRDDYKDTPYYDLAVKKLHELELHDDRPGH